MMKPILCQGSSLGEPAEPRTRVRVRVVVASDACVCVSSSAYVSMT
jgi:hypothetical protein